MTILVIGESVMDLVSHEGEMTAAHPGGSPANVALGLGRLGNHPNLITMLGSDDYAQTIVQWLSRDGVNLTILPAARTATALARVDSVGVANYTFDITWDLAGWTADFTDVTHLHTGSIAALLNPGAEVLLCEVGKAKAAGVTVSYDPNIRPDLIPDLTVARERVTKMIALSDVVKCSDEDLGYLYAGANPVEVVRNWVAAGPSLVVLTQGRNGMLLITRNAEVTVPVVSIPVVDTVGAGDSCMSALIDQLISRNLDGGKNRDKLAQLDAAQLREIGEYASAVAAITVSRAGANPPNREELNAFISKTHSSGCC